MHACIRPANDAAMNVQLAEGVEVRAKRLVQRGHSVNQHGVVLERRVEVIQVLVLLVPATRKPVQAIKGEKRRESQE